MNVRVKFRNIEEYCAEMIFPDDWGDINDLSRFREEVNKSDVMCQKNNTGSHIQIISTKILEPSESEQSTDEYICELRDALATCASLIEGMRYQFDCDTEPVQKCLAQVKRVL